jgi:hypothetical protein
VGVDALDATVAHEQGLLGAGDAAGVDVGAALGGRFDHVGQEVEHARLRDRRGVITDEYTALVCTTMRSTLKRSA